MSNSNKNLQPSEPDYFLRRTMALVAMVGAGLGSYEGIQAATASKNTPEPAPKIYVAKPGDTAWSIAARAFPEDVASGNTESLLEHVAFVQNQLPHDATHRNKKGNIFLQPGDTIGLPGDADLGKSITKTS